MMALDDPELGHLNLDCANGYVVTSLQLGAAEPRVVAQNRSLGDGQFDYSRYVAGRAVTVTVQLDTTKADPQTLYDRLTPYCAPRRRPLLTWAMPNGALRAVVCSGRGAPLTFETKDYQTVVMSWVVPSGRIIDPYQTCVPIVPSEDTSAGRTYPDDYVDGRGPYPPSVGRQARLVTNQGNAPADWTVTITGAVTTPEFQVNGINMIFGFNGGLNLLAGESVVISTYNRTILLNNDPAVSRYNRANFAEWTWDDLRLLKGSNLIRFSAAGLGSGASATLCYHHTYE